MNKELCVKVLKMVSELLRMHAEVAGDRVCQDWSGGDDMHPSRFFSGEELNLINYEFEKWNSNLDEYDPNLNFLDDEMVLSFAMARCVEMISESLNDD